MALAFRLSCGEHLPLVWYALQRTDTTVDEVNPRSSDKIFHGSGDENFSGICGSFDSRTDVNTYSTDVVTPPLDFSGVPM